MKILISRVDYPHSTPPFHMILRKFQLSCTNIRRPKMRLEDGGKVFWAWESSFSSTTTQKWMKNTWNIINEQSFRNIHNNWSRYRSEEISPELKCWLHSNGAPVFDDLVDHESGDKTSGVKGCHSVKPGKAAVEVLAPRPHVQVKGGGTDVGAPGGLLHHHLHHQAHHGHQAGQANGCQLHRTVRESWEKLEQRCSLT